MSGQMARICDDGDWEGCLQIQAHHYQGSTISAREEAIRTWFLSAALYDVVAVAAGSWHHPRRQEKRQAARTPMDSKRLLRTSCASDSSVQEKKRTAGEPKMPPAVL